MLARSKTLLLCSVAACASLAMPARADLIASTPVGALTPVVLQAQAEAPSTPRDTAADAATSVADKGAAAEVIHERYPLSLIHI